MGLGRERDDQLVLSKLRQISQPPALFAEQALFTQEHGRFRRERLGVNACAAEFEVGLTQAAAKALLDNSQLSAREIVEKSMKIAGNICIYTNENITIEELL